MGKKFYRSIEQLLHQIDATGGAEEMLRTVTRRLVEAYAEDYGIASARLYRERETDYLLIESIGEFGQRIVGKTIPRSYPIVRRLERERLVQISARTRGFDAKLESRFTALENAAILIGGKPSYILSLGIRHEGSLEELLIMLQTIRATVGLKLRQNLLEDQLRQARSIQLSLLPRRLPRFQGYEVAAVTRPAEEVGGDVYDAQRLGAEVLALAVADSSGHGLPAALQARDVLIGLRMGMARDQKVVATVQRLNRVIHRTGLSSRFISLFYGELAQCGDIFYVNAGHTPPLVVAPNGDVRELPSGGPVLGPLPEARYRRGYAELPPGGLLVAFSDGVTERKGTTGGPDEEPEEFGRERLIEVCRRQLGRPARVVAAAILKAVRDFGGGADWEDDVTIMVVRRHSTAAGGVAVRRRR